MPSGGRRPGAGRPHGAKGRKTIERAKLTEEAAASGVTPLEVMLQTMRALWAKNTEEAHKQACEIAKDAAPYLHPRLSSQTIAGPDGEALVIKIVKFAELDAITATADEAAEAVH
jgi:hypothetical protein